jgi:hypothetical protein
MTGPKLLRVLLDTNQWRSQLALQTNPWAALLHTLRPRGGAIGLPYVVEREVAMKLIQVGVEAVEDAKKQIRAIQQLMGPSLQYDCQRQTS